MEKNIFNGRLAIKKPHLSIRLLINMATTYSPAFWCSTIGHEGLNFSVRYGKRYQNRFIKWGRTFLYQLQYGNKSFQNSNYAISYTLFLKPVNLE